MNLKKPILKGVVWAGSLNVNNWGHIPPHSMFHRNYWKCTYTFREASLPQICKQERVLIYWKTEANGSKW